MVVRTKPHIVFKCLIAFTLIFYAIQPVVLIIYNVGSRILNKTNQAAPKKELFAFITSSYYYPVSKSLGNNSLALILTINDEKKAESWMEMQWWNGVEQPKIMVLARNSTDAVLRTTDYQRVTPHIICKMITVFATVQLLPNVKSISLVGENGIVEIPFNRPSAIPRDVVVCISPLFVSEQWQNFLFAVHIYKHFGAHMHLYLISAIDSFYDLMRVYEDMGYMTIQPWVSVKFPEIPSNVVDPYNTIEFRNQAASQSDCLLQFKESAKFVTFLDFDDVLIPKLAPTYAKEFAAIIGNNKHISYIHYHKENHDVMTVKNAEKFSFERMLQSLTYEHVRETGKMVAIPTNLNYTWIHFPPYMPRGMTKY
ncbi:unnamed protein product [Caenorhabditis bovis]|uniref:Glycosyltransferase family 92 protein n=1 Tax=Caenorhabditis bovis TaxID=2654633 RepID=A0A8S1E051_9PELO|nr:unnamed protein product [Caenorhabditis bovis]